MSKKENKTNAMRILERNKISYEVKYYECDEFKDGISIAKKLDENPDECFKTLATKGKSGSYYIYVLPVDKELDLKKCARAVGEKSVEMIPVKEINRVTGYIRGGTTALGMKKDYPVVVHQSADDLTKMIVSGGKLGVQIKLTPKDYLKVTKGKMADIIKS
ncbi:MAG: Cys-tRNA(Pro) deacylase [Lachnospiraceae bacterium]|nr:Cys-tRNA(Pro) deacylase [Lachnospiraceae bacterium]